MSKWADKRSSATIDVFWILAVILLSMGVVFGYASASYLHIYSSLSYLIVFLVR